MGAAPKNCCFGLHELAHGASEGEEPFFPPTARNREARRLALLAIANIIPSAEHKQRGLTALLEELGDVGKAACALTKPRPKAPGQAESCAHE